MSPLTTRLFLGVALILACVGAVLSVQAAATGSEGAWGALAGVLAVVTSVVSAWGAQRVVELEEDKLSPYVYPQALVQKHEVTIGPWGRARAEVRR